MNVSTVVSDEFVTGMVISAVENGGHGWFSVEEYRWESLAPGAAYAVVIAEDDDDETPLRIDRSVILAGLDVIETAVLAPVDYDGDVLHNATTGDRLYMSRQQRDNILAAAGDPDGIEYDAGDLDALDALAIVECGLFGCVVYG